MAIETRDRKGKTVYMVRIDVRDPMTNRRKRVRVGTFTNKKEAERAEFTALDKRDRGTSLKVSTALVRDLMDEYLQEKVGDGVHPNTLEGYKLDSTRFIKPALGAVLVVDVNAALILRQRNKWLADGLTASRVRRVMKLLRAALASAVRLQLIANNPAEQVKYPEPDDKDFDFWSKDEAMAFLRAAKEHYERWTKLLPNHYITPPVIWDLAIRQGMRRGEILGLAWSDIDWDASTARIRRSVVSDRSRGGTALLQERTKTRSSSRTINLSAETLAALKVRRTSWLEQKLKADYWEHTDLIVCNEHGGPLNPQGVGKIMRQICKIATADGEPLRTITFHQLRHTAASLWIDAKIDPKDIQEQMGHSSVAVTLDIYGHLMPARRTEAAVAMSKMLPAV